MIAFRNIYFSLCSQKKYFENRFFAVSQKVVCGLSVHFGDKRGLTEISFPKKLENDGSSRALRDCLMTLKTEKKNRSGSVFALLNTGNRFLLHNT